MPGAPPSRPQAPSVHLQDPLPEYTALTNIMLASAAMAVLRSTAIRPGEDIARRPERRRRRLPPGFHGIFADSSGNEHQTNHLPSTYMLHVGRLRDFVLVYPRSLSLKVAGRCRYVSPVDVSEMTRSQLAVKIVQEVARFLVHVTSSSSTVSMN